MPTYDVRREYTVALPMRYCIEITVSHNDEIIAHFTSPYFYIEDEAMAWVNVIDKNVENTETEIGCQLITEYSNGTTKLTDI